MHLKSYMYISCHAEIFGLAGGGGVREGEDRGKRGAVLKSGSNPSGVETRPG